MDKKLWLEKVLDDWGFKSYNRQCKQPDKNNYGKEITVPEEWTNKEVAELIITEIKHYLGK
jgi:hypothetical protein